MQKEVRRLPCGEKAFARIYRYGYTTSQAEELLGIPQYSVRNWFSRGRFSRTEAVKILNDILVLPEALIRVRDGYEKSHE